MVQRKLTSVACLTGVLVAGALLASMAISVGPAFANVPLWWVSSHAAPADLPPGGNGEILVDVSDISSVGVNGSPVTLVDKLPPGLTVTSIGTGGSNISSCNVAKVEAVETVTCESGATFTAYQERELQINVSVAQEVPSSALNVVSIEGGGGKAASSSESIRFGSEPPGFGVDKVEQMLLNEDGTSDTQAGSHPWELVTTIQLNEQSRLNHGVYLRAPALVKDLHFDLPPGLIGNANTIPQCTFKQFTSYIYAPWVNDCPNSTVVGVANVRSEAENKADFAPLLGPVPIFNLAPNVGEPATFAFQVAGVPIILDTSIKSGGDYGVVVSVSDINTQLEITGSQVTFWGTPSERSHDLARGWGCMAGGVWAREVEERGKGNLGGCSESPAGGSVGQSFLTLPTSCTGPLRSSVEVDSWAQQGVFQRSEYSLLGGMGPLALDGCNRLPFEPSIRVTPDGQSASSPTGLAVTEHVPQEVTVNATGLAESDVKNTTVALPLGIQLNPAGGDGLLACSSEQMGFVGRATGGELEFSGNPSSCPEASKVGTVKVQTPVLPHELTGAVYLAAQNANPFGSLVALYIVARDPVSGVLVKAAGEITLDPVTGQVVTTFKDSPQLPYENLELHFFGSARAPLTTPPLCGEYTTHTSIEGWSGNPPAGPSSSFQITSGPNGSPCADPRPFQPGFESGTTNLQAGAYTPFELTMTRPDQDQTLDGVETDLPPGLVGSLSSVKLCEEPQAAQGACSEESLIGHTIVSAGLGGDPYTVSGGKVFITGPYKGAPFGLSILEPAVAGPFNLGMIVVRAAIRVDPLNSHLTVVTDPLPTIIDGIPIQIQHVNVSIDRPAFVFNPTNCEQMKITGALLSTEGETAGVSSPFQVTNCASLAFKPTLSVSTKANTSRTLGASLHVSLTLPAQAGKGTEANVAKVKVSLPKQLPSPLKTLQKACVEKVFAEDPANCPVASQVGEARVSTPLLSGPLTGKAYFVSHGGAKYPELIMVLVGEDGVTVQVHGETFISKQGITSATFSTVPDVPFSNFELTLPQREYPALSANGNLCKAQAAGKLLMPTEMVAQNGLAIKQSTKITVTGCPKAKHKKKSAAKKKAKHKAHKARGHKKR